MKRTGGTLIDVDVANWKITIRRQSSNWHRRASLSEDQYNQPNSPHFFLAFPAYPCYNNIP